MQRYSFLLVFIFTCASVFSQEKTIKVSETLTLTQLNKNTYIHTSDYSNGLVYIAGKEAVIISTPPTDKATQELLVWIQDSLKAKVTACIVDHWHHDAMEGIDILHQNNIPTYSYTLTQKIAKEKGLTFPKNTFDDSLVLSLGDKKIIARYFGPSHSADDIVVWLPNEQILFGSCGVKSKGGWVGNIADAHLGEWSNTIEKVKTAYSNTITVIPGHGKHGDTSLLSYTIEMFMPLAGDEPELRVRPSLYQEIDSSINYNFYKSYSTTGGIDTTWHQTILINNDSAFIAIHSLDSNTKLSENSIKINEGSCSILNKKRTVIKKGFIFRNLIINFSDDESGMIMIIKEFVY